MIHAKVSGVWCCTTIFPAHHSYKLHSLILFNCNFPQHHAFRLHSHIKYIQLSIWAQMKWAIKHQVFVCWRTNQKRKTQLDSQAYSKNKVINISRLSIDPCWGPGLVFWKALGCCLLSLSNSHMTSGGHQDEMLITFSRIPCSQLSFWQHCRQHKENCNFLSRSQGVSRWASWCDAGQLPSEPQDSVRHTPEWHWRWQLFRIGLFQCSRRPNGWTRSAPGFSCFFQSSDVTHSFWPPVLVENVPEVDVGVSPVFQQHTVVLKQVNPSGNPNL